MVQTQVYTPGPARNSVSRCKEVSLSKSTGYNPFGCQRIYLRGNSLVHVVNLCEGLGRELALGTQWNQGLVLFSQTSFLHGVGPQNSLLTFL